MKQEYTRRNFIKITCLWIITFLFTGVNDIFAQNKKIKYIKNKSLTTILSDYIGNPIINNKFVNEEKSSRAFMLFKIIKWKFSIKAQKDEKDKDKFKPKVINNPNIFTSNEDMIVWLGHSSFFIRLNGKTILIDPKLTSTTGLKRRVGIPFKLQDINNIDYLLISHAHRDHLDANTLKQINLKNTLALVPLGVGSIIKAFNKDVKIQEAGWYQKFDISNEVEIILMPAQHWSNRFFWDINKTLWGSYIIKSKKKCIYFSGDTAYAPHFKNIQKLFNVIDYSIMPIGAYKPDYIMKESHVTPAESVTANNELGGKTFIPMHYGTYDLSDEPWSEPLTRLMAQKNGNKLQGTLRVCDIGEILKI